MLICNKNSFLLLILIIILYSCGKNHKNIGDGIYISHRKYVLPVYEIIFPKIDISSTATYEFKVGSLNSQRSIVGLHYEFYRNGCEELFLKEIRDNCDILNVSKIYETKIELILKNTLNEIIIKHDLSLENLIWSCSKYQDKYDCFIYSQNAYFHPIKHDKYILKLKIINGTKSHIEIEPIIKSTISYSLY